MKAQTPPRPCTRCGSTFYSVVGEGSFCLNCAGQRVFAEDFLTADKSFPKPARNLNSSLPNQIGPYEIIEELGRGGMGRVYAARQIGLGRIVALKVIGESWNNTPDVELRFLREAQTVGRLRHPHIIAVHDSGRADGLVYFSMEFIEGGDLATRLKDRVYTPGEAAALLQKVAGALAYAHDEGVLHRDVKPSNILLEAEEPRLADFGLAAQLEAGGDLTAVTGILGTPHYLAPEALSGGSAALAVASDLYALGVVLFEMLTGRTPFAGASPAEIATLVAKQEPPSPRLLAPAVPRDLETICLKCLERDPARRYTSAAALAEDLRRFRASEPIIARPISSAGRFVRWSKRKPALAAVLFLVTAIAVGSTGSMIRIHREQVRTEAALTRTRTAEATSQERLRDARLAEARAIRRTDIPGRRAEALAALAEAARIRSGPDLRDEALAAFLLYDVKVAEKWDLNLGAAAEINLDPKGTVASIELRNVLDTSRDSASLRKWGEAKSFATIAVPGTSALGQMRFSRDGRLIMARYLDETLRVFRVSDGTSAMTIPNRPAPGGKRTTEAFNADYDFTPDAAFVALGLPGKGVALHRIQDGAEVARWAGDELIHSIAISPDGRFLAAANMDGEVSSSLYLLSLPSLAVLHKIVTPSTPGGLTWSADSRVLAVAQRDSSLTAYDVRDGRLLTNVSGSSRDSREQNFLSHDSLLATRGVGNSLHLINTALGREELAFSNAGPSQLAVDSDGGTFVMSALDGNVTRMAVEQPLGFRIIPAPRSTGYEVRGNTFAVDFSPDGRWIATSNRNFILLLDAETGRLAAETDTRILDSNDSGSVVFSADGKSVYRCSIASTFERFPIVAQPAGGWSFGAGEQLDGEKGFFIVDQTADRQRLALLNFATGAMRVISVVDGKLTTVNRWIVPGIYNAAFNPDGTQLLINTTGMGPEGASHRVRVYRVSDGSVLKELPGKVSCDTAWSADGKTAMTSNGSKETTLWDTANWHAKAVLRDEVGGDVTTFAISPDSSYAVITHDDRVHLVSTADGSLLTTFESPAAPGLAASVRFLPDRKRFAILWHDGRIDIIDPEAMRAGLANIGLGW
jgi:WD40 repeat protein